LGAMLIPLDRALVCRRGVVLLSFLHESKSYFEVLLLAQVVNVRLDPVKWWGVVGKKTFVIRYSVPVTSRRTRLSHSCMLPSLTSFTSHVGESVRQDN
jgi:hypothetical protein